MRRARRRHLAVKTRALGSPESLLRFGIVGYSGIEPPRTRAPPTPRLRCRERRRMMVEQAKRSAERREADRVLRAARERIRQSDGDARARRVSRRTNLKDSFERSFPPYFRRGGFATVSRSFVNPVSMQRPEMESIRAEKVCRSIHYDRGR